MQKYIKTIIKFRRLMMMSWIPKNYLFMLARLEKIHITRKKYPSLSSHVHVTLQENS